MQFLLCMQQCNSKKRKKHSTYKANNAGSHEGLPYESVALFKFTTLLDQSHNKYATYCIFANIKKAANEQCDIVGSNRLIKTLAEL